MTNDKYHVCGGINVLSYTRLVAFVCLTIHTLQIFPSSYIGYYWFRYPPMEAAFYGVWFYAIFGLLLYSVWYRRRVFIVPFILYVFYVTGVAAYTFIFNYTLPLIYPLHFGADKKTLAFWPFLIRISPKRDFEDIAWVVFIFSSWMFTYTCTLIRAIYTYLYLKEQERAPVKMDSVYYNLVFVRENKDEIGSEKKYSNLDTLV